MRRAKSAWNSLDSSLSFLVVLISSSVVGESFWGGYLIARRLVPHPVVLALLTLLFGPIRTGVVGVGLIAGSIVIAASPMFR